MEKRTTLDPTKLKNLVNEVMHYYGMINPIFVTIRKDANTSGSEETHYDPNDPFDVKESGQTFLKIGNSVMITPEDYNCMLEELRRVYNGKHDTDAGQKIPEALVRAKGMPAFKQLRDALAPST